MDLKEALVLLGWDSIQGTHSHSNLTITPYQTDANVKIYFDRTSHLETAELFFFFKYPPLCDVTVRSAEYDNNIEISFTYFRNNIAIVFNTEFLSDIEIRETFRGIVA